MATKPQTRSLSKKTKKTAENDSQFNDAHLEELIAIVKTMDKTLLTPENMVLIHQNAQYAKEIKEAFQTLHNEHKVFNPSLFKAIMAFAEHELLLHYSSSPTSGNGMELYSFFSPEEIKHTHRRNIEALAFAAHHGEEHDPEEVAKAIIQLKLYGLLNNRDLRFHPEKNLQQIVCISPCRALEIANFIIYLKYAGILNQQNIDKLLGMKEAINSVLDKFKKDKLLDKTPSEVFPNEKRFESFLNNINHANHIHSKLKKKA